MNNNQKIISTIFHFFFVLAIFIMFIADIVSISDLSKLSASVRNLLIIAVIIELIFFVGIITIGIANIFQSFKKVPFKLITISSLWMISIYCFSTLSSLIFAYVSLVKLVNQYGTGSVPMPTEMIIMLILLTLSIILFIAGTPKKMSDLNRAIIGTIASTMIIIVLIISLATSSSTLSIISGVFMILSLILGIVLLFFFPRENNAAPIVKTEPNHITNTNNVHLEKAKIEPQYKNDDIVYELKKLKALCDEGLITQEEYQEKRKKYVDKL